MRRWITGVAALGALLLVGAIALGLFDPLPTGDPSWSGVPVTASLKRTPAILWQEAPLPSEHGHLRLPLTLVAGDPDLGAGLVLGGREAWLGVAVSPLGYVRVWEDTPEGVVEHLPWQPWPHVQPGMAPNNVDVSYKGQRVEVFLNRERLWAGDLPVEATSVGFWGVAYGGPATVRLGPLQLFAPGPS